MTVGGLMGGFKLSESGDQVLTNDIVQLYYAQKHLQEQGCQPGEVFGSPVCAPYDAQGSDGANESRRLFKGEAKVEAKKWMGPPRSLPGNAVLIMYEAVGTNCPGDECDAESRNLLTERNMKAMKKFEDTLFGARDFQQDYCLLRYPAHGDAAPVCNPPTSML